MNNKLWILHVMCVFLLGLQLCFPIPLRGALLLSTVDEVSVQLEPSEDPDGNATAQAEDRLTTLPPAALCAFLGVEVPSFDRDAVFGTGSSSLVPVAGLQPSAP